MRISLDYDNCYTQDPDFWLSFIGAASITGHEVVCVTMRYPSEVDDSDFDKRLKDKVNVYATGRKAKRPFMENAGIPIDVWIDDMPVFIENDARR